MHKPCKKISRLKTFAAAYFLKSRQSLRQAASVDYVDILLFARQYWNPNSPDRNIIGNIFFVLLSFFRFLDLLKIYFKRISLHCNSVLGFL